MALAELAMRGIQERAKQPSLLDQMKARKQQEEAARLNELQIKSNLQTAETQRQYTQVLAQKAQAEINETQRAAQRQQRMTQLLSQYTDESGNPDYRKASRVAFGFGEIDIAKDIQGLANTQQLMAQREIEMTAKQEEGAPKRLAAKEQKEVATAEAAATEARVKQQDSAVFDLAQVFGFDQEDPPENLIEVRERYIDLVNTVGSAKASEQIKQEYEAYDAWGPGGIKFRKVPELPKQYTLEEAKKLPSGTVFYDTNGVRRKKP